MKNNSKKAGSLLGLFSMLLKNIFSFFLTPMMIVVFGKGDFGVYKIVISTTTYFMLLDMGMHNVIIRYISKYKYIGDTKSQNKYLGLVQIFYIFISLLILLFSIIIYKFIPTIFCNSLTIVEIRLFSKIFVILTANSMVTMIFNAYAGVIKAHEKFMFFKTIELVKNILRSIIIYVLLMNNLSIVSIVIVDLAINLLCGFINFIYVFYKLKLKPEIKYIKKKDIKEVLSYSSFIFIEMIAVQLFWASDSIILGILTSSTLVTIYSAGTLINGYFQSFAGVFSEFLMPSAVRMVEEHKSREELSLEMARIGRYIFIFLGLILVGFCFLGDKFMVLWLGKDFELAYLIAIVVMIPQIFSYSQYFGAGIMWAKNKHKRRSVVMLLIALLNVGITIILVNKIGIFGAAIGTWFAYVVGHLIYTTWYYHRYVGLDMIMFMKELFKKIYIAYIPILFISYLIRIVFVEVRWDILILQGVLITCIYCILMYFIGMKYNEKLIVEKILNKYLKKRHKET